MDIQNDDFSLSVHFQLDQFDDGKEFPVQLTMAEMKSIVNVLNRSKETKLNKFLRSSVSKLVDEIVAEDD